jgi:TPR repeat protein
MRLRFASVIAAVALLACGSSALAQDRDDNLTVLRSAADAGDLRGLFALGNRFLHGQGVARDYQQALAYFRAAADQGFPPAENQLGVMYERGLGVPKDYLGAMNYFRQAADQGYPLAQYNLGRLYDAGLGTRVDNQRAFDWFRKAANQGQPDAQDAVGFYYQRGVGAPQVFGWALDWYQKAANQGSAQAANDIGHLYQTGLGVQRDYEQALSWYYKAAEQGNSDAQDNIGYMYEHGLGLEPDFTQAQMWFRRAAGQGSMGAANNLGYMYDKGEGVRPDYGRALAWYQVAANQGYKTAIENIELLRNKLQSSDPEQWEAANRYARRVAQEQSERIARTKDLAWEAAELELDARQEENIAAQLQPPGRNVVADRGANAIDADKFRKEAQKYRFEAMRLRKSLTEGDAQQAADFSTQTAPSPAYVADRATYGASPQVHPLNDDDPPSRVAQLRYIRGRVSFQPAGTDDWNYPSLNRPMTTGDKLWADEGARAELGTDSAKIRLNSTTGFSFLNLNDHITQIRLNEGSIQIHLRRLDDDESFEVDTPNLALSLLRPGNYRLDVNEAGDMTVVTVRGGEGEVTAGGLAFTVRSGQAGAFTGIDEISPDLESIQGTDDFDDWCRNQDRREEHAQSARYVSRDVIGYEDLDNYGEWRHVPQYGDVWVPTAVAAGWAPYHNGHWAWVSPWGWTWVDDAPWGFAPFHYGRWAYVSGYWAWCPGPVATVDSVAARPVYAPALVAWVGSPRLGSGNGAGVAWFALGPREVYVPPYRVSPTYVTNVNVTNTTVTNTYVTNVVNNNTTVTNVNVTNVTYVNKTAPGAVTAVPQSAFTSAQPVAKAAVQVDVKQLAVAKVATNNMVVEPQAKSVVGAAAPAVNVPKPPDSTLNRAVVAKVAPPPQPVPFAVQQKIIQQNGGRPVSAAEIQRQQVQQHLPQTAAPPVVKMAPPVAVGGNQTGANASQPRQISPEQAKPIAPPVAAAGNQTGANPGQSRQNDAKQNQHAEAAHSEKESPSKPAGTVISPEQAKPANQQNGLVRDMRAPLVNQPEHASQPQITNVTNKSEVKANPQTQAQPAAGQKNDAQRDQPAPAQAPMSKSQAPTEDRKPSDAKSQNTPLNTNDKVKAIPQTQGQPEVLQKNDARRDQPIPAQAPVSKNQAPTEDRKPSDAKSQNATPNTNDKVKAIPQTQGQPEVLQKNDARRDQPIPTQAPVSKSQAPAVESKPSDAKSQNAPPTTANNPANRAPTAVSQEDQRKQAEPKGQDKKGQEQKGQPAQPQQKPDKNQKASDKPAQQP